MEERTTMRKLSTILALAGGLAFLGHLSPILAADEACAKLQKTTPGLRLQYLQGDRAGLDRGCVIYAIKQLGNDRYAPAIETLVGYLDFREPGPRNWGTAKNPFIPRNGLPPGGLYPAVGALFQIGKTTVPKLIEAIADSATTDLVRANAGDTVLAIYCADPPAGIAAIVSAAHANADPAAAIRLMDEARRQASLCIAQTRNECENSALK
jgi:hypothetical protein